MQPSDRIQLVDEAVQLARELQASARTLQTSHEARQQAELDRMLQKPSDKATLVRLTDQAFRSRMAGRTAENLAHILDVQGIPQCFGLVDRALLAGFQLFGDWWPGVSVPWVKEHMRRETANVILPAEVGPLTDHLRARHRSGLRMNLNLLGETVLGEAESARRLQRNLDALSMAEVEVLSIKISTLCSQISPLARERTLDLLEERLASLYRAAGAARFARPDGSESAKFVYLDMEEYRDLELTAEIFMRTLDRPEFANLGAGIALQAYIPDSAAVQRRINEWARRRLAGGGAPVTVRLVKGANLEMERVEASVRGWPQAPFKSKLETDANFKRMLEAALRPENLDAVRVGVASHNLFDIAYALVLAARSGAGDRVQFEMLEGMANHQRRALQERTDNLLLYAPACRKGEFLNAIGYLIRRLDENTGAENFLRHTFRLTIDSPEWRQLEQGFRKSFEIEIRAAPRRTQNRATERNEAPRKEMSVDQFDNEPDTDWALPHNSAWAAVLAARRTPNRTEIPIWRGSVQPSRSADPKPAWGECRDPSNPGQVWAHYQIAGAAEVERAVECAQADAGGWRRAGVTARSDVLGRVSQELRRARGGLIWAALANGGKTVAESDPEVSEAVDFVEFYRASARYFYEMPGVRAEPRGVVVVVAPWNFPIAIPCGGIAAALAAGNTVILKPASDTVLVAAVLCECFWRGGVPREALQLLPCSGADAGAQLVAHPGVDTVVLTGGTATALGMLAARPDLRLSAETGGKNATIVTAASDRELAVQHIVQSAFSHSGQKCSATSLLLLEEEVYDDPRFKEMLCDAVTSLPVGSAWDLQTRVGPLIRPPEGALKDALTTLDAEEAWAVEPRASGSTPNLWSPGVKYGVQPGSATHLTELFGPVLGVMRCRDLDQAIEFAHETGYGLTSGLESLDDREQAHWRERIYAGNLYINRSTVGAVVLRQPFGGYAKSSFGPGLKAGGPNYVTQFLRFSEEPQAEPRPVCGDPILREVTRRVQALTDFPESWQREDVPKLLNALGNYEHAASAEFLVEHDALRLLGQDNIRRYRPVRSMRIRIEPGDSLFECVARIAAARAAGTAATISVSPLLAPATAGRLRDICAGLAGPESFVEESAAQLAALLGEGAVERVRFAASDRIAPESRAAAARHGVYLTDAPVLSEGRLELLYYVREQSISFDYHRYGNLGSRADEPRREPE